MPISVDGLDFEERDFEARLELLRGPRGAWRTDRRVQVEALERLGLRPEHRLLEIGCGPLVAGAPLIRFLEPGGYTGVDISTDRLKAAGEVVRRFGLEHRSPTLLLSSDFGRDQLEARSFDRVWCFHVVIHLSEALVGSFMAAVSQLLKADGIGWFSAWVTSKSAPFKRRGTWLDFPVTEAGQDFFCSAAAKAGLDCVHLGVLEDYGLPAERPSAKNGLFQISHRPGRLGST